MFNSIDKLDKMLGLSILKRQVTEDSKKEKKVTQILEKIMAESKKQKMDSPKAVQKRFTQAVRASIDILSHEINSTPKYNPGVPSQFSPERKPRKSLSGSHLTDYSPMRSLIRMDEMKSKEEQKLMEVKETSVEYRSSNPSSISASRSKSKSKRTELLNTDSSCSSCVESCHTLISIQNKSITVESNQAMEKLPENKSRKQQPKQSQQQTFNLVNSATTQKKRETLLMKFLESNNCLNN